MPRRSNCRRPPGRGRLSDDDRRHDDRRLRHCREDVWTVAVN